MPITFWAKVLGESFGRNVLGESFFLEPHFASGAGCWAGLGWPGLGWGLGGAGWLAGLGWAGLGWAGLGLRGCWAAGLNGS